MRCWTDGKRSAFWKNGRLDWVSGAEVKSFEGFDQVWAFGPTGALAVHPTRDVVWVGGDRCGTWRIDIASGARRPFSESLADLCYRDADELWAIQNIVDADGRVTGRRMVRFADAADAELEAIEPPQPRPIRWPYGAAYKSSAPPRTDEQMSGHATFRMTRTEHGICVASTDGFIWGFPRHGDPFGWAVAPVYQGWLVAELVEHGVLATAQHNGRTGEVVLINQDGCWTEAYDSRWNPISPAVVMDRQYFLGWNTRFLRSLTAGPLRPTHDDIGPAPQIEDLHAAADESMAVWLNVNDHGAIQMVDGYWTIVSASDPEKYALDEDELFAADGGMDIGEESFWAEYYRSVKELGPGQPWTWERKYLPEFPELSPAIPDLERAEGIIDRLEAARSLGTPKALSVALRHMRWNFPSHNWSEEWLKAPRLSVYRMLLREDVPRRLTRKQVRLMSARAIDPELSEFERFHARECLMVADHAALDGLSLEEARDALFRDFVERAELDGEALKVVRARLGGRVFSGGIGWSGVLHLNDSVLGFHCDYLSPDGLSMEDQSSREESWVPADGTYNGREIHDLEVAVELFEGRAHRLALSATEPEIDVNCIVNFRGLSCPGITEIGRAIELAAREVDLDGWYAEVREEGVMLSVFADDLKDPTPCQNPAPHPATRRLIERLVQQELLDLSAPLSPEELRRVQWVLFSGLPDAGLIEQLEKTLFAMDAVADLFGTAEALAAVVSEVLAEQ